MQVGLKLKSSQRVVNFDNRIVMAEGRMELLDAIVETGSINKAAKMMGMSYKSAWSKLRTTEAHLNTKIVLSDKAKGTSLTQAGQALLKKYKMMKKKCVTSDDAIFNAIFNSNQLNPKTLDSDKLPPARKQPIISFVGHSGSGKTTFIEKLIPLLVKAGLKVAIIKHDVHGFEMDKPGKDTWRHKKAGAAATMISSPTQIGLVMDVNYDHKPHELAPLFSFADVILTEGFKYGPYPKLEVFRPEATGDSVPLCLNDPQLLAIISDAKVDDKVPVFGLEDTKAVAIFLENYIQSILIVRE